MELVPGLRLWELPYAERIDVVRDEIGRITGRLGELDGDLLDQPAIGDWSIREVVAHLVVVADFYTDNIHRGAGGDGGPAEGWPPAGSGRGEVSAPGIAQTAAKVADALGSKAIDRLRESALSLAAALDGDESGLEYDAYHPGGILPANRFAVLYLKELGLHEWDIFEAIGPPCAMRRWGTDAALQAMEEELASGSLRWLTDPDPSPGTVTFRVLLSGAVPVERDLILDPDQTRLVPVDQEREVDSLVNVDSGDFVLACSGRRALAGLVAGGQAEGDAGTLDLFDRRLTGM
jgi:hypothetical protein